MCIRDSTRAAWANFSKVIFSYVGPPLAALFAGMIGEKSQYGATAFVLGCIMAVLYFAHFKMFDGYEEAEAAANSAAAKKDTTKTGGMDLIKALLQNPPLLSLLLADLAKWMFNFVCSGVAIYYFTYVAQNADLLARYILISNLLCVIGSYFAKNMAKKISTRSTTIVTFFAMAVILLSLIHILCGQSVDHRGADTMKASACLIRGVIQLSACMQCGEYKPLG